MRVLHAYAIGTGPEKESSMKLVARIRGEDPSLVARLRGCGVTAKLVKGAVIAELPKNGDNGFVVHPDLGDADLRIDIVEGGGGLTKTGSGIVVCDVGGYPLTPYRIPRHGTLANAQHAYFSVPIACVTVQGFRNQEQVIISEHHIVAQDGAAFLQTKRLWSGDLDDLPEVFAHYRDAATAARLKSNCYHCRHVHFAVKEVRDGEAR